MGKPAGDTRFFHFTFTKKLNRMNIFYNNFRDRQEAEKGSEEKRERSFGEQMFPVVIAGHIAKGIIHVLSFCGAVILPAYGFDLLFGSFYIGLMLGFIGVLVFIEIPKWAVVNTISENYFDSKIISYGLSLVALVFIIPSIASSTYGVPIAVWWLSPDAEIISIEDIENKYAIQKESALAYYEPQINKHSKDAVNYFTSNKKKDDKTGEWRLSTSHDIQYPYNEMLKAEKYAQTCLNSRLDSIQIKMDASIASAVVANNATTQSHDFKKQHAGNIAFWVMLCLEFSYVLIVFGLGYIAYRSKEERIGIELAPNQTESNNIKPIRTESNQIEQEQPIEKQAVARNPIKFGNEQHGQIFTPQGAIKQRVRYLNKDGILTDYSKADLVRMKNRSVGSEEFKQELERLINLF